jgi:hypothetical protein
MEGIRSAYILAEKPDGKTPPEKCTSIWEHNFKIDVKRNRV